MLGRGVAIVEAAGEQRRYQLDFEYKIRDRYNWDNGKFVYIGDQKVTGEFHRQGLGREFDCVGSSRRELIWTAANKIPADQMHSQAGRS